MTDTEINLAIAEHCGWRYHESTSESGDVDYWAHPIHPTAWSKHDLPQYATDLNAMHEAEKVLQGLVDQLEYLRQISGVHSAWNLATATARERANAFLRTLSK